jgi:UDP-glucose 4-epimerase
MNILITGSNGFIASKFAEFAAKKKIKVYGIGRSNQKNISRGYTRNIVGELNIKNLKKFKKKFDYIFHCAGHGSIKDQKSCKIKFSPTLNLLKFVYKNSPSTKIIFTSSASVYGNYKKKFSENTRLKPISVYGKNKQIIERQMFQYAKQKKLDILVLRISSIYGEGLKKQFFFECCSKIKNNKNIFFGHGNESRDWLHIRDFNLLILKILNKSFKNFNIFNCGTGKGYKIRNVIKFMINENKKNIKPKFNGYGLNQNPKSNVVNIHKIKKFNWKPKINFWKGVSNYVKWYNKNF